MTFELARMAVSAAVLPLLCAALVVWRRPPRTTALVMAGFFLGTLAVNAAAMLAVGYERYERFIWVFNTVALLAEFAVLSRYGGWRLVFAVLTGIVLFCAGMVLESLVVHAGAGRLWGLAARFGFIAAAFAWVVARLRPIHRQVAEERRSVWAYLCLLPALFIALFLNLVYFAEGVPAGAAVLFAELVALLVAAYQLVYVLFLRIDQAARSASGAQALAARAREIEQRMEADRREEQALLVERHDMRHRLDVLGGLLAQGRVDEAAAFIGRADGELARPALERLCREPALDAVAGAYAERARAAGVAFTCELGLPDELPADALELAVALANALENALAACEDVPEGERRVTCRSVAEPFLIVEVANSCAPGCTLGPDGRPRTDEPGHGFGTRSLAAFAERYGATCDWDIREARCTLRLAFPPRMG
ncbi:GHKL domain-containing protein [Arabiibacter massiliensis]|uniref:GHKL domain-containing protein n=1 Tax=Arabiibacter massiliensis TaxID=1870985 RepID=UPI0009BB21C0|nr:GHKL domain-containing protein [Arabiibacter massiliensis]